MQLSDLQTSTGKYTIAAFDHRASLAEALNINLNSQAGVEQFLELKQMFMELYSPISSAVLTDPIYGKKTVEFKDPSAGLLISLEESGYEGGKEVVPPLLENWGVLGVKGYNSAAKLLLYYHPEEKNAAAKQALVQQISQECAAHQVPFLLEPVLFPAEGTADFEASWHQLQSETVETFDGWCDVLKIEYPGLYTASQSEAEQACARISEYASKPWIILSRGMAYAPFRNAVETSMQYGASGFAVGRAVWQEIEQFKGLPWTEAREKIRQFLETTGTERMQELIELVG